MNRRPKTKAMLAVGIALMACAAIGFSAVMFLRSRAGASEGPSETKLTQSTMKEGEIRKLLQGLPDAGWHAAQEVVSRLGNQDRSVCRKVAIETLEGMAMPSAQDFWTMRALSEIAGHPLPSGSSQAIIGHFRKMEKNREMLGPALVLIGTEAAGKALIEAEEANEGRYFSRIAYPLEESAEHGRLDAGFRAVLSAHLATRAEKNPSAFCSDKLGSLWLMVDSEKAVERLTREPFWSPSFEGHWEVLQSLVKSASRVAEDRLWRFDELLKRRLETNPNTLYPNPDVVWLLARIHSDRVDPLIEKLRQVPDMEDQALAAQAALLGILQPRRVVHRHLESPGYASSPSPVRHLWALQLLGMELVNGGIHQYFLNSSGDLWRDALDGLDQAGYAKSAAAFRLAVEVFGSDGPSADRPTRLKQLRRLSKSAEAKLNSLGDQVYQGMSGTNTWPYIMRHAEIFRIESPRPPKR